MKVLIETKDLMQDLVKQILELTKTTSGNTDTQQQQRPYRGRNVVCYGCGVLGHIVRDCPQKGNNGRNKHPYAPPGIFGDSAQGTGASPFKLVQAISGGLREACSENNGQLNFDRVEYLKSIKTSRKLPDGIYIRGSVQGYPIIFTADTGASKTIISRGTYETMDLVDKPTLVKSTRLVGPTGTVINELGQGTFSLKLGEVEIEVEAVVADIDDDGLLGIDVLQNGNRGPADLLLSKGVLRIQDEEVPIIQVGLKSRVQRVTSDHTVMPAQAEAVIRRGLY